MQGQTLRRLRRERELTQTQLGRMAGVSLQTVNSIERGRSQGTVETVANLARALDVTVDELMGVDSPKIEASLALLNGDQRRLVVKMLALRGELPLMEDLRELAKFKRIVRRVGLDPESEEFRRWYRTADEDEVREALGVEGVNMESQLVGLK